MSTTFARNLGALSSLHEQGQKQPPDPGLLSSIGGEAFFSGTDTISSSDTVRATLEVPAGSDYGAVIYRIIVAHDQSGLLPVEFIRGPTTDLPTTSWTPLNLNMDSAASDGVAVVNADTGVAMTGGTGGAHIATTGSVPTDIQFNTPMVVRPDQIVGLNAAVGSALSSGSVMVLVSWIELTTTELDNLSDLAAS